jgi:hypothetical protein
LWERNFPLPEFEPSEDDYETVEYHVGRHCHHRTELFHKLMHYKYKLLFRLRVRPSISMI